MLQKAIFGFTVVLLLSNCSGRQKDSDELVQHDFIKEINGIYYMCDCEVHCGDEKMTLKGENYYSNRAVKNTWKLTDGRPDSLWVYYDSLGHKTMEILFNKGMTINKKKF